jgi:protein KTI12
MALVTFSGFPCSGKSTRAAELKAFLDAGLVDGLTAVVLSDDALHTDRAAYADARAEKAARGALLAAVQRALGLRTVLVLDGLNYIKGWRYQLYCAARELRLRVCTVHVVAPPERCQAWNAARPEAERYAPETYVLVLSGDRRRRPDRRASLDALIARFEEPSSMVRWDAPLFTVTWDDGPMPCAAILTAITSGAVKPPNAGTSVVRPSFRSPIDPC